MADENSLGALGPNVISVEAVSDVVYSVQGHNFVPGFRVEVRDAVERMLAGGTLSGISGTAFTLTLPYTTPGPSRRCLQHLERALPMRRCGWIPRAMGEPIGSKGSKEARSLEAALTVMRLAACAVLCAGLEGCVVIGGSSRGGLFVWPGGLGLLFLIFLFVLLMRRR